MFTFAKSSINRLGEAHPDLKLICETVKDYSGIDYDISESYRNLIRQQKLYKEGKSTIDGVHNRGKHNMVPAEAVDIYCYDGAKGSYSIHQMTYMAGLFQAVSQQLYKSGKTTHIIRWGGNWDSDGEIITDQEFDDLPHFEIIKP